MQMSIVFSKIIYGISICIESSIIDTIEVLIVPGITTIRYVIYSCIRSIRYIVVLGIIGIDTDLYLERKPYVVSYPVYN